MFKTLMLSILKGMFDRIYAYSESTYLKKALAYTKAQIDTIVATLAPKDSVYTKQESNDLYRKLADPVNADTLQGKSLATVETERNLAIESLRSQIMAAIANNMERVVNTNFFNGGSFNLVNLATDLLGTLTAIDNGNYMITFTGNNGAGESDRAYVATATLELPNGTTINISNNDYFTFKLTNGTISDMYHRNDVTNTAINSLVGLVNSKADKTFLDSEILRVIALIDGKDLSAYYTKTQIDAKIVKRVVDTRHFVHTAGTANYTVAQIASVFANATEAGAYVVPFTAHGSEFEAVTVTGVSGETFVHQDQIVLQFDGANWTYSHKLNTHFNYELIPTRTELFAYIDGILGN